MNMAVVLLGVAIFIVIVWAICFSLTIVRSISDIKKRMMATDASLVRAWLHINKLEDADGDFVKRMVDLERKTRVWRQ